MPTGYIHPDYARSLSEFGTARELSRCGGWILEREIPGSLHRDAMGCYPLFACQDWSQLAADLEDLRDLVSLVLVTDPFGSYDLVSLQRCFRDLVIPFKEHYVVDLARPMDALVSSQHRRNARKAREHVAVERCVDPPQFVDEWTALYSALIDRHSITGIPAFSRQAFAVQLQTPGLVAFRALSGPTTVSMLLWYVQDSVAYYHLGASSSLGYEVRASFALFWHAIERFAAAGLRFVDLGSGAGTRGARDDGLSRFKRGWSSGTRTAYLCGRVIDQARYSEIVKVEGVSPDGYFPAYRQGEFA